MGKLSEVTVKPEEYFRLSNGRVLKNLYELMNSLESMDNAVFASHVNEAKNDFGNWVKYIFKDESLARSVFESKTKDSMRKAIESRMFDENKPRLLIEAKNERPKLKDASEKKLIKAYPFSRVSKKPSEKPQPVAQAVPAEKVMNEPSSGKLAEILAREKEIEKREEKIEEIEERIEKELGDLSAKRQSKFFSREFIEGLLIGLLLALVIGLAYIKFFS